MDVFRHAFEGHWRMLRLFDAVGVVNGAFLMPDWKLTEQDSSATGFLPNCTAIPTGPQALGSITEDSKPPSTVSQNRPLSSPVISPMA